MMCVHTYVRTCPSRLGMLRSRHAGMSRCHAYGLRNSDCHVCVRMALAVGARSSSLEDLGRRRVERFGEERSGTYNNTKRYTS